jgi:hypothetical protein
VRCQKVAVLIVNRQQAWPERKLELLREMTARSKDVREMVDSLDVGSDKWKPRSSMIDEANHVVR